MQIQCAQCGQLIQVSHSQNSVKCSKCHATIMLTDKNHSVEKIFKAVKSSSVLGKSAVKELDKKLKFKHS